MHQCVAKSNVFSERVIKLSLYRKYRVALKSENTQHVLFILNHLLFNSITKLSENLYKILKQMFM